MYERDMKPQKIWGSPGISVCIELKSETRPPEVNKHDNNDEFTQEKKIMELHNSLLLV